MKKDEIKKKVIESILGSKRGVNVFMSPNKLSANDLNTTAILKNWTGNIEPKTNAPDDVFWFAFVDHMPNANWEHPVEYIFINDKTGETQVIRGSSPPDNLKNLEKIQ